MNFKSYLNLYEVLQHDNSTKESRRAFGLSALLLQNKPYEQLEAWVKAHKSLLKNPSLYDRFSAYLYGVTFTLVVVGFVLGLFSGVALLHYNGEAPVNVIYFMAMVIAFPLLTMSLTLISILKANKSQSVLVHLSPAFWMEKLVSLLPKKWQLDLDEIQINPLLANWIVIKRSQLIALFFSFGLLVALLIVVATQDIAFAWSTTLDIKAESFHAFLETVSTPWKTWLPSAVPSLELITQSQYFRLGERLSDEMINHASILGQWWKFLAMATLFYAIILRFLLYLLATLGLKMAVKKSLMRLEGVSTLLHDMNEPIISTTTKDEKVLKSHKTDALVQTVEKLDTSYDVVQGWAMGKEELLVLNDAMGVITPLVFDVGGSNTLEEDMEIIHKSHGEVLLYVKAWEPPTMDFMDYMEALLLEVDKVVVCPVGMYEEKYVAEEKYVEVWLQKLSLFQETKVWVKLSSSKAQGMEAGNAES